MSVIRIKKLRLLEKAYIEDPRRKYNAVINKIKPYILSFELEDYYLEGSLHISELHDDFYIYDQNKIILQGQRTNKIFSLGNELSVIIDKIDLSLVKITWKIDQKERTRHKKQKKSKNKITKQNNNHRNKHRKK